MIDQLFAIVCYVSSGATAPDWTVTGPAAEISEIEYRLEELMYDAAHDREVLADGTARLRFKVPAETPYRTFALLFDEIERRELNYTRPRPVPGFCPHGGSEGWHDRVEASENPNTPGPIVGVFGTDAQLARFRETPEWNYRPARLVDGRVGLTFSPTWAEIDNYAEYLSQVRAEFGAIDIVLMEPVDEAPPQGDLALRCDGVDFRDELRQLALIQADWSRAREATFEFAGPAGAMSGLGRELERLGFGVQPNDVEPGLVATIRAAVDEDWARGMVTRLCNTAATHGATLRGWRTSTPEAANLGTDRWNDSDADRRAILADIAATCHLPPTFVQLRHDNSVHLQSSEDIPFTDVNCVLRRLSEAGVPPSRIGFVAAPFSEETNAQAH